MSVTLAAYQDILYCSRPVSRHPKMSIENRAKLFTPFSALRGFDIEILTQEQDRLLMPQISLASDREEEIYRVLNGLHQGDWATVSYFIPVKTIGNQTLGEYTMVSGEVKRVDDVEQLLVLEGASIPFGNIHSLVYRGWKELTPREGRCPPQAICGSGGHPLH